MKRIAAILFTLIVAFGLTTIANAKPKAERLDNFDNGHPKVTICHLPPGNPENAQIITVGPKAALRHMKNHGDFACTSPENCQCPAVVPPTATPCGTVTPTPNPCEQKCLCNNVQPWECTQQSY